ncbi:MAG: hypothetical protein J2P57_23565, partial [Acidimicrobiaceae bacterium]|nr:hypothetical protein [Acidimicrobiaceae bacterium]
MADGFAGQAFIQLAPSFVGFHQAVGKELNATLGKVGSDAGKQMGQAMSKAGSDALGSDRSWTQTATSIGKSFADSVSKAISGASRTAATAVGTLTAGMAAYAAANTGAYVRAQQFEQALSLVGAQLGISNRQIDDQISGMKGLGASTQTARDTVMTFMRSRMDLTRATELYSRAEDIAVATGQSGNEVQAALIHGIETLNPLVLRNAGVT